MGKKLYIQDLLRLTLTRKGQAVAKHPMLRSGVVEAVKAVPASPVLVPVTVKASQIGTDEPLWLTPREEGAALARYTSGHWS